jgi:hypothetical protein
VFVLVVVVGEALGTALRAFLIVLLVLETSG